MATLNRFGIFELKHFDIGSRYSGYEGVSWYR